MNGDKDEAKFVRQLAEATELRRFATSITEGKHHGEFQRKDYIGLILFNRCLQLHEATQLVARNSLIDDAWVLVRALSEHAVNAIYMFTVADAATADNFNDYHAYLAHKVLLDLKATDELLLRQLVSVEDEEKSRIQFEAVRDRFDDKRGDKWCVDDALYRRAARVDAWVSAATGERRTDLLWLVNTIWRYASGYTHGAAGPLSYHIEEQGDEILIRRKYTYGEAAKVMQSANGAMYLVLLPLDIRLGGNNADEIRLRFNRWSGAGA